MRKKFTLLIAACALLVFMTPSMAGWGQTRAESVHYTLDGTITATGNAYAYPSTVTQNGMTWSVTANTEQNPWRIGGKGINGVDRPIKSTTSMGSAITKLEVSVGATASGLTVNSIKLVVASDASFNTVLDEITKTSNLTSTTLTYTPTSGTEWAKDAYYNIVFNVTRTSSSGNGYVAFNNAKFYKEEGASSTPSLSVSPASIAFGEVAINSNNQQTFTVTYANLTQDLTVAGFNGITVSPATIQVGEGSGEAEVTVTYAPTAVGSIEGNITVSNTADEVSETVAVTGSAYDPASTVYYTLVEGEQTDWSGVYIITYAGSTYEALTGVSNNLGTHATVTVTDGNIISNSTTNAYAVTITKTTGNQYSLQIGGEYLYAQASNNLYSQDNFETSKCEWTISYEDSKVKIFNVDQSTRRLQYNTGSPRFACYTGSQQDLTVFKLNNENQVATPTFSPAAGTYTAAQNVSIACATDGATILYKTTENGEWQTYSAAINVSETTTIWAQATKEGMDASQVTSATYTITLPSVATPTFTPAAGTYEGAQSVTIACETSGATIYYTTDGSEPTTSSSVYSTALNISQTTTVKAMAVKQGMTNSAVATAVYTITSIGYISDITAAGDYIVKGTIVAISNRGFVLGDGTGYVYYYKGSNFNASNYSIGDKVKLSGTVTASAQYKVFQFGSDTEITAVTESNYVAEDPTTITGAQMDAVVTGSNVTLSNYVQYEGTLTVNNTYYNITSIDGANTAKGSISYPTSTAFTSLSGKTVKVTGYYVGVSNNQYYNTMIGSIEEVVSTDPTITVNPATLNAFTYEEGNGPSEAQTLSVSGENLTGNIFINITGDFEQSINGSDYSTGEITLQPDNGTVTPRTVYIRLAANLTVGSSYSGTITLTSTNATPVQINISGTVTAPVGPNVTWDLTTNSYNSESEDLVTWTSNFATMTNAKGESQTNANNALGGSYSHTRFYQNQVLTIAPVVGYAISSIVINAVTSYVGGFTGNNWTNASASAEGTLVTVTPTNGNQACSVVISAACRATAVTVYYTTSSATAHDVTIDSDMENGTITADPTSAIVGTTITLTVAPDQGYYLADNNIVTEPTLMLTKTADNTFTFTMPDEDVTVMAMFTAIPMKSYWYSVNGVDGEIVEVAEGTEITLDGGENLNANFTFAGWTTDPDNVTTLYEANSDFTINDDYTFYAVYSHTTTIGGNSGAKDGTASYVKVTSTDEITNGEYLIVSSGTNNNVEFNVAFNGALSALDPTGETNTINVTIDNNTIASSTEVDAATFTIAEIVDNNTVTGYSIQSKSGIYIGRSANSNGMDQSDTEAYSNAVTYNSTNEWVDIVGTGNAYLRYNAASGTEKFRYYKSSSYTGQKAIQLYKYTAAGGNTPAPVVTTAKYTRVFLNETMSADYEIVGPSVIPSGKSLNMNGHTLTNGKDHTRFVIEDGGQYFGNAVVATAHKSIKAYPDVNVKSGYTLIASPMAPTTYNNSACTNLASYNYDLYAYDANPSDGKEWRNFENTDNSLSTLNAGQGYLYANSNNLDLLFMGTLNTEIDDVDNLPYVENNTINSLYLAGNSLMHEQTFYVYDDQLSSAMANFLTINAAGDVFTVTSDATSITVAPMQGFFVQAGGEDWTLSTTDINQTSGNQITPAPQINVKVKRMRGAVIDNAIVSLGNAPLMNKFMLNENATKIYVPMGNEEFAVVRAQAEGETPLCFKASENGNYTIVVELKDVEMNYLHLIDNMTGANVDLLATPSYSFEARTTDYASRFRLVFSANNGSNENGNETFAYYNGSEWVISNMGDATLQVVDVMGRVLSSETVSGNANVSLNQTPGVYMLRLVNNENVRTQKIVVR